MKDYYQILQIDPEANLEVMNNAYRTLVRQYHPDLYHTHRKDQMNEKMQEINEAYNILSNPITRQQYDQRHRKQRRQSGTEEVLESPPRGLNWKNMLLWSVGTFVLINFALRPFLTSPAVKALMLIAVVYLLIRIYSKKKTP
jgi:curved DNA-binding protein CbpA